MEDLSNFSHPQGSTAEQEALALRLISLYALHVSLSHLSHINCSDGDLRSATRKVVVHEHAHYLACGEITLDHSRSDD